MPIDYSKYPDNWKTEIRPDILKRADNRCEWCGVDNYDPHPVTGSRVVLTIAHIDQDKTNNGYCNLAALCQRCHLGHDRPHHIANRKANREAKRIEREPLLPM